MWYVGQIVICVDNSSNKPFCPPLTKGAKYVINGIRECPNCKAITFDVGLTSINNGMICSKCDNVDETTGNIHYADSIRFRPLQEEQSEEDAFLKELSELLKETCELI